MHPSSNIFKVMTRGRWGFLARHHELKKSCLLYWVVRQLARDSHVDLQDQQESSKSKLTDWHWQKDVDHNHSDMRQLLEPLKLVAHNIREVLKFNTIHTPSTLENNQKQSRKITNVQSDSLPHAQISKLHMHAPIHTRPSAELNYPVNSPHLTSTFSPPSQATFLCRYCTVYSNSKVKLKFKPLRARVRHFNQSFSTLWFSKARHQALTTTNQLQKYVNPDSHSA